MQQRATNPFSVGDDGDAGDTLGGQWPGRSPSPKRPLGTLGTEASLSIECSHVPTSEIRSGDSFNPHKHGAVPTVPGVPKNNDARPPHERIP
jgi:hypothetical protein